jgi:hypothetical protein
LAENIQEILIRISKAGGRGYASPIVKANVAGAFDLQFGGSGESMTVSCDGVVIVSADDKFLKTIFQNPKEEKRYSIESSFKETLGGSLFHLCGENQNINVRTSKSGLFFKPCFEIISDNKKIGDGVLNNKFPPSRSFLELKLPLPFDLAMSFALAGLMWRYLVLPPRSM